MRTDFGPAGTAGTGLGVGDGAGAAVGVGCCVAGERGLVCVGDASGGAVADWDASEVGAGCSEIVGVARAPPEQAATSGPRAAPSNMPRMTERRLNRGDASELDLT